MIVIDLLNKIANGEINEDIKIEYQYGLSYEYCTIREFFDRYIVDKENLNQDITLEDTPKEDKKIKRLGKCFFTDYDDIFTEWVATYNGVIVDKLNEIIDRLIGDDNE